MTINRQALLVLAVIVMGLPNAFATTLRLGVFVGSNDGSYTEDPLFFAERNAEKMMDVFGAYGGVQPELALLLKGQNLATLRQSFSELATRLSLVRKLNQSDVECIFYYSGHGGIDGLHIQGEVLPYRELQVLMRSLECNLLVVVLDSCNSGELLRTKGVHLTDKDFRVNYYDSQDGEVIITSRANDEYSQESDAVRGAVFTHHLVNGLLGEADANHDQRVTLSEAYAHAYENTLRETFGSSRGYQHPSFSFAINGQQDPVLTTFAVDNSFIETTAGLTGTLAFMNLDKGLIWGEFRSDGQARRLPVPKGHYWVRYCETSGVVYLANVHVGTGTVLEPRLFSKIAADSDPLKGGRETHAIRLMFGGAVDLGHSHVGSLVSSQMYGGRLSLTIDNVFLPPIFAGLYFGVSHGSSHQTLYDTIVTHTSTFYEFGGTAGITRRLVSFMSILGQVDAGGAYAINETRAGFLLKRTGYMFRGRMMVGTLFHLTKVLDLLLPEVGVTFSGFKDGHDVNGSIDAGMFAGLRFRL